MTTDTITIRNAGPIDYLEVPLRPGITVLRGRNGSGWSPWSGRSAQTLVALERLND